MVSCVLEYSSVHTAVVLSSNDTSFGVLMPRFFKLYAPYQTARANHFRISRAKLPWTRGQGTRTVWVCQAHRKLMTDRSICVLLARIPGYYPSYVRRERVLLKTHQTRWPILSWAKAWFARSMRRTNPRQINRCSKFWPSSASTRDHLLRTARAARMSATY